MTIRELVDKFYMRSLGQNSNPGEEEDLLHAAMEDNRGHGMNIKFHGQHFGWYRWDKNKQKHVVFSIASFKNSDSVGELEDTVATLKNIKLEDYA